MTRLRTIFTLVLWLFALPGALRAQEPQPQAELEEGWVIEPNPDQGWFEYNDTTKMMRATNGVIVRYRGAVLTADQIVGNLTNGQVVADGTVRIQHGDQIWASEHIRYNFNTYRMEAAQFRTGKPPVFAAGAGLHAEVTNQVSFPTNALLVATNALLTTDDAANPVFKLRAKRIKIVVGKKIEAYHATLYVGNVPVAYFPFFFRNLGEHANHFNFTPGYRTIYGAFLLGNYTWYWNEYLDGIVHLDYRSKRGFGGGPDFNYNLGRWGSGTLRYYYAHDEDPNIDQLGVPIPEDRQRLDFAYLANPATNLTARSLVRYNSDVAVVRDFFVGEYRQNPQPNSYFEANKFWQNFSLSAYVEPRVNNFLEVVERLPDIKLTGYRQQLGASPFYYESQSSAGYYRFLFAEDAGTNGPPPGLNYSAARADTYHQVLLPETFFGWLNVAPRVGGRFTYYSEASGPGARTDEQYRGVFNTGTEVSFKASRLWPGMQNDLFEVNGLRHIIQPSANYVFVPSPTVAPSQLPQFDFVEPSLRLLPIDFPDFNDIDSIDSQNVIRWGLNNKLQTKRDGKVVDLVNWDLYTDWRLKPNANQTTFSDLFSDLAFRPRSTVMLESLIRYDINNDLLRMSFTTLTLQPSRVWAWRVGHYYLRSDLSGLPGAVGPGNNVLNSAFFYQLNENWGFRMSHYFEALTGRLQEQAYTVYRDLRSWTVALTFLTRENATGPKDYTVAFTFSFKAYPRYGLNSDIIGPYPLLTR